MAGIKGDIFQIDEFISSNLAAAPFGRVSYEEVYMAYRGWAERVGARYGASSKQLAKLLQARGFQKHRTTKDRYWLGVELKSVTAATVPPPGEAPPQPNI